MAVHTRSIDAFKSLAQIITQHNPFIHIVDYGISVFDPSTPHLSYVECLKCRERVPLCITYDVKRTVEIMQDFAEKHLHNNRPNDVRDMALVYEEKPGRKFRTDD